MSANGSSAGLPDDGLLERVLDVVERLREDDRAAVDRRVGIRIRRKHREPVQRQVDLHRAAAGAPAADVVDEPGRQLCRVHQAQERDLGVRGRDDHWRVDRFTAGQLHPRDPAVLGADARDLRSGPDLGPERPGRPGQRPADRAHAAAREPPGGLADVVVQHHVRGPRRPRAGPRADHAGHGQQAQQRVALEVPVEQVRDAAREQPDHVDRAAFADAPKLEQQPRLPHQFQRSAGPEARWDLVQERPEHLAELGQVPIVPGVRVGVARGELGDLGVPLLRVVGQPQVPPVGPRREVGSLRVHVVPLLVEPQVAHEVWRHQRDHVGQRRHRVVRPERVLADRRAAYHVPPLAHHRRQPRAGQVGRRDQSVVPAAHHHDIRVLRHRQPSFRRSSPSTVRDPGE